MVSNAALLRDLRSSSYCALRTRTKRGPRQGWHVGRPRCVPRPSARYLDFGNAEVSSAAARRAGLSGDSTGCIIEKCLLRNKALESLLCKIALDFRLLLHCSAAKTAGGQSVRCHAHEASLPELILTATVPTVAIVQESYA